MSAIALTRACPAFAGTTLEWAPSKRTVAQSRNIRRPRSRRSPMEAAVLFRNLDVVDAGFAAAHQAVFVEFPLLVAVGAMPLPASCHSY